MQGLSVEQNLTALQQIANQAIEFLVRYSFQVIGAILILIMGLFAARWLGGLTLKLLQKRKCDITLAKFITGSIRILILTFAVLVALSNFGITIAPLIAALGAVALGSTFAFQGPLSNYGAGFSIILGRPFVVGNTITVAGVSGIVEEITLAFTQVVTEDGVKITIPNKHIVGEVLHNSGTHRIVEATIGISYDSDPVKAQHVIQKILDNFSEVTKRPPAQIGIQEFGDSAIVISYRYWVPTNHFFQISYAVNLAIFQAFQSAGINIPFPQRDVHLIGK
jgi:small conductance mechanosensitive channel